MNFLAAYEDLYSRFQPFSREASLLTYIAGEISEAVDTCSVDRFGNLITHRSGRGKRVMLSAQADVPTVLVTYLEGDGSVRFLMTGKSASQIKNGSRVRFGSQGEGVVSYDRDCAGETDLTHMRILPESGALQVGDKGILSGTPGGDASRISGPHSAIAAGCMALMELARSFVRQDLDLYYVFSIGSEAELISQRGVKCAAFSIKPNVAVSIETIAAEGSRVFPGGGPVVLLRDEHAVLRRDVLRSIRSSAERGGIPLQYVGVDKGARETALYHYQCAGAYAWTLAIPVARHLTAEETVMTGDIFRSAALVRKFLEDMPLSLS